MKAAISSISKKGSVYTKSKLNTPPHAADDVHDRITELQDTHHTKSEPPGSHG